MNPMLVLLAQSALPTKGAAIVHVFSCEAVAELIHSDVSLFNGSHKGESLDGNDQEENGNGQKGRG